MPASGSSPNKALGSVRAPSHERSDGTINNGRTISPTLIRDATAVETISSTISALSRHASTGLQTLSTAAAAHDPLAKYKATRQKDGDTMSSSPSPIFGAMGGNADPALQQGPTDLFEGALGAYDLLGQTEHISWAAWGTLPTCVEVGSQSRQALLIAYASGGLQIFIHAGSTGQSKDQDLREIFNFQQFLLPKDRVAGRVLAAKLHTANSGRPCLLLVTLEEDATLVISRCSLTSQMVTQSTTLPQVGPPSAHASSMTSAIQVAKGRIVVAQSHPPALHVLDTVSLSSLCEPIVDVSSSSLTTDTIPAFHLSGRMLVYASTVLDKSHNVVSFSSVGRRGDSSLRPSSSRLPSDAGYTTSEQMRLSALEAGAQASDIAKRVGGGLMAGAKNLGDWGSSYLSAVAGSSSSQQQQQQLTQGSPTLHDHRSPSPLLRSPRDSPSLVSPRLTGEGSGRAGSSLTAHNESRCAATVKILDLFSAQDTEEPSVRVAATFRPGSANIASVKLDPTSSNVFVADSIGHAFNIFEIRPRPRGLPSDGLSPPAIHRCKLLRGVTTAQVCDARWTSNGQWLGVLTYTGTVHVYKLGSLSGPRAIPLSATLTSFARTPRPKQTSASTGTVAEGHQASAAQAAPLDSAPGPSRAPPAFFFAKAGTSLAQDIDVLCFHPAVAALSLSRVTIAQTSLAEALASSASDATNRVSGLTVMMRRATTGGAPGHNVAATPMSKSGSQASRAQQQQQRRRPHGECVALAIWTGLARTHDAPEVQPRVDYTSAADTRPVRGASRVPQRGWASMAEIETYDRTPRALQTSIYLSHQIKLRTITHPAELPVRSEPVLIDVPRSKAVPLQTREAVQVEMASEENAGGGSFSGLAHAIASPAFDESAFFDGQSPSQRIPSFPQGQAARRPSWRKSVTGSMTTPIRITAAASRDISRGVVGSLRKPNTKAGGIGSLARSSPRSVGLSFDDDISHDTHIFADARNAALSPNGGPSSLVSAGGNSPNGGAGTTSTGSGSADTADTAISEALEDEVEGEDEERSWAAARGMQEDVEGDHLGWDSFAEFSANKGARRKDHSSQDDFLVGGLALDEEVGNVVGSMRPRGAASATTPSSSSGYSPPSLPPFSRKSPASGASYRSGGSFTPGRGPASFSSSDVNGEGAQSGSEGSKHTSTTITTGRTVSGGSGGVTAAPLIDKTALAVTEDAQPGKTSMLTATTTTPAITIQKPFSPPGALPSPAPASLALPPVSSSSLSSSGSSTSSAQRKGKKR